MTIYVWILETSGAYDEGHDTQVFGTREACRAAIEALGADVRFSVDTEDEMTAQTPVVGLKGTFAWAERYPVQ